MVEAGKASEQREKAAGVRGGGTGGRHEGEHGWGVHGGVGYGARGTDGDRAEVQRLNCWGGWEGRS